MKKVIVFVFHRISYTLIHSQTLHPRGYFHSQGSHWGWVNANFRQFWRDIQLYQLSLCSQASQAIDPSWKPPILIILTGPSPTCGWPTWHKMLDSSKLVETTHTMDLWSMHPKWDGDCQGGLPGLPVVQVSGRTAELHGLLLLLVICQGFGSGGHWGRQQGLVVDHMPHDVPVKRQGSTGWRSWLGERKYHDQTLGKSS